MSPAPLLNAAPAIPLHAFVAMTGFALGVVQFAAPKGTLPHRAAPGADHAHRAVRPLATPEQAVPGEFFDLASELC
jgi:hypothetical protein